MKPSPYLKILRSTVMATAAKQLGWDIDTLHDMMFAWGFGSSLRKLSIGELQDILKILRGSLDPSTLNFGIGTLDAQGRYMWSLMKDAGWTFPRLRKWMLKHCSASHWNALDETEKRGVIAMLKKYASAEPVSGRQGRTGILPDDNVRTGGCKTAVPSIFPPLDPSTSVPSVINKNKEQL